MGLEALAEEQARQAERLTAAKAASNATHGGGDDEQSGGVDEPEPLVKTLELRQAEPKERKPERKPRVLSKALPRGQKRAMEVFEAAVKCTSYGDGGGRC
eukprot:399949-Prymnesium_polylepis.1